MLLYFYQDNLLLIYCSHTSCEVVFCWRLLISVQYVIVTLLYVLIIVSLLSIPRPRGQRVVPSFCLSFNSFLSLSIHKNTHKFYSTLYVNFLSWKQCQISFIYPSSVLFSLIINLKNYLDSLLYIWHFPDKVIWVPSVENICCCACKNFLWMSIKVCYNGVYCLINKSRLGPHWLR